MEYCITVYRYLKTTVNAKEIGSGYMHAVDYIHKS
jgi:hypothetical protein